MRTIKKAALIFAMAMVVLPASAEGIVSSFNDKGYGVVSGRVQYLGMYRDFDNGNNGNASTLGLMLGYTTPKWAGFDMGLAYNYAGTLFDGGNSSLVVNDDINVLNEAWVRLTPSTAGLFDTELVMGRKINNGEVFRADDYRQKSRSIQAVQINTGDIPDTTFTVGHAVKLSNWIDAGDLWEFNNFGDVFDVGYATNGITWGEGVYTGMDKCEVALFGAYAWDVANLVGTRVKYDASDTTSLIFRYRYEKNVGKGVYHNSNAYGISLEHRVHGVTIEPGYFGVSGDNLLFQETTTGINHPLGVSMMIFPAMFAGGADTAYLKVTAKINNTALYGLYNYTWQESSQYNFNGQELDLIVKHPLKKSLSIAFKFGVGARDAKGGGENTRATDTRLFLTYAF